MSEREPLVGYWTWLDSLGWPVVRIKGRPVLNFFRILIHARRYGRFTPPIQGICHNCMRGPSHDD